MPTLFISYKRGTGEIIPLMERLRAARYRLWYDKTDIHASENWQAAIDQGIDHADAVIVGLTRAACESPYVKYELDRAKAQGKPIFPCRFEILNDSADLARLGIETTQYIDFTGADPDTWDKSTQRLLDDLKRAGFSVTRHDLRVQRDRHNPSYTLHQTYLTRVAESVGTLSLAQIAPDQSAGVLLENVYVDSPTKLTISVEVKDWRVIDWWLTNQRERGDGRAESPRLRPADLGYEVAPLEPLIDRLEGQMQAEKERKRQREETGESVHYVRWSDKIHHNVYTLQVQDIAAARDRLVILGGPGSGKSTFVRHLALCLAGAGLDAWTRPADLTTLGAWPHGALTPVYVELRRFVASSHYPTDIRTHPSADHLWHYIQNEILGTELAAYAPELKLDLESGHAVLILDGLDEVPYRQGELGLRQRQLAALSESLNVRYRQSRIIVASRPYAYEGWKLPGFEAVEIADFEDQHRIALAGRLYREAGLNAEAADAKAQRLNEALAPIHPELKDRPLFLTLMATIFHRNTSTANGDGGLPTRRGALYHESIRLLLERWTTAKPGLKSLGELLGLATADDLMEKLAVLAYDVHQTYGDQPGAPEIPIEKLHTHLMKLALSKPGVDVLGLFAYLSESAGVLVSPGQDAEAERDVFRFAHRTFQEYLAAAHLTALCEKANTYAAVRTWVETKPLAWREPCALVGDVLADRDRTGELWDLLDDLVDDDLPETPTPDDPRWLSVWLAGRIVIEQELYKLDPKTLRRGERAVRDTLIDWLLALIETPCALIATEVKAEGRALAGRALGLLGDPRPGTGVISLTTSPPHVWRGAGGGVFAIPDIAWCEVPAGPFLMGSDKEKDPNAYDDETPQREVDIPYTYWMAKYPITYAQYEPFVNGDGYTNSDYWTDAGWEWKGDKTHPEAYWRDPHWHVPNHPVVGVTWYEAYAYTR